MTGGNPFPPRRALLARRWSALLGLLAGLAAGAAGAAHHITGIDVRADRATVEVDGPARYRWFRLSGPERLVLDIHDARLEGNLLRVPVAVGPVRGVRSAARGGGDRRVVLDLTHRVPVRVRAEPDGAGGRRIVVDLDGGAPPAAVPAPRRAAGAGCPAPRRGDEFLVVLDAGHGGRDEGAVGPDGWREKDLALDITRRLHRLIGETPGMRSVLTRERDEFIPLGARARLARACGADLFVSIHADSLPGTGIRGASVYVHPRARAAARRVVARRLAAYAGRLLPAVAGGLPRYAADRREAVDLASYAAAANVLVELGEVGPLVRGSVLDGRFVVLSTGIPSMLVETGYISHPDEERDLADPAHQLRLATALRRALVRYAGHRDAAPQDTRVHIVGRPTTLPGLAGRLGVDPEVLRRGVSGGRTRLPAGEVVRFSAAAAG